MSNLVFVNTLINKLLILPLFFLTMCGTAPVTPPAGAFELVVEESHWDKVYHAIEYIKTTGKEILATNLRHAYKLYKFFKKF